MKIHVACGGTGGHIFPGLATAEELLRHGHEVTLWMAGNDMENLALKGWPGRTITVPAQGFQGGGVLRTLQTARSLFRATRICKRQMQPDPPDALLAMGSYASVGPVRAASQLGVPVILHEANVIPGRAIRLCAPHATTVAAAFDETRYYLRSRRLEVTGMPLRRALVNAALKPRARSPADPFTVLIIGGSRGAQPLNRVVAAAAGEATRRRPGLRIIHLAGTRDEAATRRQYELAGVSADVRGFCPDMGSLYPQADLAICRAGASTCAELALYGLPALLVPYPHAARNHQAANARALEKTGAADLVLEEDLEAEWLAEYLVGMQDAAPRLARMRQAAQLRARGDAAAALAVQVERAAGGKSSHENLS
ncbi:MAG: UDP-N-acetylglucosamine--N-acetylmuramyl-(pentapeptide) pyrophosphoryl-undecaprenol N-acetylglucosamine transferase [Kiritimatiellia bacterium]|nr:UDP-N-acetylglucosamine--N-acetylmuramyl-(pentapeptide) pyrophosphoryl-undecaprenol N-acetylglucosamine transferase [Kiritimatiellia bacterium]